VIGVYNGTFHDMSGCYGCTPYIDTTYPGYFLVDTFLNDSIIILRSFDNYSWKFKYYSTGNYSRGVQNTGVSFYFKDQDSLHFYYNYGGSGGYSNEEFFGKK